MKPIISKVMLVEEDVDTLTSSTEIVHKTAKT